MQIQRLRFDEINPHVRHINLLQCCAGFIEGPRRIYDHQFVYVHKGRGRMEIAGHMHTALPGDLFFYGPGVVHAFYADQEDPYLLSGIHFDFTGDYRGLSFPIGPFGLQAYREYMMTREIEFTDFGGFPPRTGLHANTRVRELILEMYHEFEGGRIYGREYINGLFKTFLAIAAREILFSKIEPDSKNDTVSSVIRYIQEHYSEDLTNESIAARFHFHPNYLNQLMAAHTGIPLRQYLIDFRIRKALDMLLHTRLSIAEISGKIGYRDLHYFSRVFKKKTGMTLVQVRAGLRQQDF